MIEISDEYFEVGKILQTDSEKSILIELHYNSMGTIVKDGVFMPVSLPVVGEIFHFSNNDKSVLILEKDTMNIPHKIKLKPLSDFNISDFVIPGTKLFY